jgi:SprA family protein
MFQVAAISVATEPVNRIRSANLRDPTVSTQLPPEGADSTSESVFEDPAAVVHIGAQARALARRESDERPSQRPAPKSSTSDATNGNGPLAEAARSAAQARASATVEASDAEEDTSSTSSENPLAEAATSAAKALWDNEEEDDGATNAADEADDSSPDLVRALKRNDDDVELSAAEERKLDEMQQRDREVRQQEQSQATSAQFTGPVRYEYRMGPDGKLYAVEGSAPIDVQPVEGDPAATLRKMEAVERAARSNSEPTSADQQVASEAARLAQRARAELAASRYNESRDAVDVRRQDEAREAQQQRSDETQSSVEARAGVEARLAEGVAASEETREVTEPMADVLSSAARSVEGTFSDAASAATLSSAPVDLAFLNPGTPPALRRYEEQQRPSAYPGAGFQLVA